MTNLEITQHITDLYQQLNCLKNGDCCAGLSGDTTIYDRDGTFGTDRRADLTDTFTIFSSTFSDNEIFKVNQNGNVNFGSTAPINISIGKNNTSDGTLQIYNSGNNSSFRVYSSTIGEFKVENKGEVTSLVDDVTQAWFYKATNTTNGLLLTAENSLNTAVFVNSITTGAEVNVTTSSLGVNESDLNSAWYLNNIPYYGAKSTSIRAINSLDSTEGTVSIAGHTLNINLETSNNAGVFGSVGIGQGETSTSIFPDGGTWSAGVYGSWTRQRITGVNSQKSNFGGLFEVYINSVIPGTATNPDFIAVRGHSETNTTDGRRIGGMFTAKRYGTNVNDTKEDIALLIPGRGSGNNGNVVIGAETRRQTPQFDPDSMVEITGNLEFMNDDSGIIFTRPDGNRVKVTLDNSNNFIFTLQ